TTEPALFPNIDVSHGTNQYSTGDTAFDIKCLAQKDNGTYGFDISLTSSTGQSIRVDLTAKFSCTAARPSIDVDVSQGRYGSQIYIDVTTSRTTIDSSNCTVTLDGPCKATVCAFVNSSGASSSSSSASSTGGPTPNAGAFTFTDVTSPAGVTSVVPDPA